MNTHDMKVAALQRALEASDKSGSVEQSNFNQTWTLKCSCFRLTDYGFYLLHGGRSNRSISENEAAAFLYGMGQVE